MNFRRYAVSSVLAFASGVLPAGADEVELYSAPLPIASAPGAASGELPPPSAIAPDSSPYMEKIVTDPRIPLDSGLTRLVYTTRTWLVEGNSPPLVRRDGNLIEIFNLAYAPGCPYSSIHCPGPAYSFTADLGVLPAGSYTVDLFTAAIPIGPAPVLRSRHTLTVAPP